MDNFELHEQAQQLADTHTAYQLARMLIVEREKREKDNQNSNS
jgi:hypothetical protein